MGAQGWSMTNHEYAWELLYHFNCGECKNWWSYATTENRYQWKQQTLSCPLCGYRAEIQPKDVDAGFPIIRHTKPGYPFVPFETDGDMVDHPEVKETTPVSEAGSSPTVSEKQADVAKYYPEDTDRDFFVKTKVYSDGRGGVFEVTTGGVYDVMGGDDH